MVQYLLQRGADALVKDAGLIPGLFRLALPALSPNQLSSLIYPIKKHWALNSQPHGMAPNVSFEDLGREDPQPDPHGQPPCKVCATRPFAMDHLDLFETCRNTRTLDGGLCSSH